MVNDEVNNKAINIEIKVAQYSAKAILKAMKKIIEDADEKSQPLADYISEKRKTNSRKLKDMVKKGFLSVLYHTGQLGIALRKYCVSYALSFLLA